MAGSTPRQASFGEAFAGHASDLALQEYCDSLEDRELESLLDTFVPGFDHRGHEFARPRTELYAALWKHRAEHNSWDERSCSIGRDDSHQPSDQDERLASIEAAIERLSKSVERADGAAAAASAREAPVQETENSAAVRGLSPSVFARVDSRPQPRCPCGKDLAHADAFCTSCGRQASARRTCTSCGQPGAETFCACCGARQEPAVTLHRFHNQSRLRTL